MRRGWAKPIAALVGLFACALAVAAYVLVHERLPLPWKHTYTVRAEFPSAQAVTPGQGQQVTVAGVKVGEVSAVHLRQGRAVVSLRIEKSKLDQVGEHARMLIRPKTPLQDMSIDLDPGPASDPSIGDRIVPLAQTRSNVNVDEVLAGLDSDTRAYFRAMLSSLGTGLGGRGINLRRALQATSPTAQQLARLDGTLNGRRGDLRRLVSELRSLTGALAGQRRSIRQLVRAGNQTFSAIGDEQAPLRRSLALLPGTLDKANTVIDRITPFSRQLATTTSDLVPVARDLDPALKKLEPFVRDAKPAVDALNALTPEAQPVATDLRTSLRRLRPTTPALGNALKVTRYAFNELGYIPDSPNKSLLFWLAWFGHNANSMLSTQDANGAAWRAVAVAACTNVVPLPGVVDVLAPLFAVRNLCPKSE